MLQFNFSLENLHENLNITSISNNTKLGFLILLLASWHSYLNFTFIKRMMTLLQHTRAEILIARTRTSRNRWKRNKRDRCWAMMMLMRNFDPLICTWRHERRHWCARLWNVKSSRVSCIWIKVIRGVFRRDWQTTGKVFSDLT